MVEQRIKSLGLRYQARIQYDEYFLNLFSKRANGSNIKIKKSFEANFDSPTNAEEKEIKTYIDQVRANEIIKTTVEIEDTQKRLASAEEKILSKPTKAAQKEQDISKRKLLKLQKKLEGLKSPKVSFSDSRIYAFEWAPIIISSENQRQIVPMRYHLRPAGSHETFDRKYPGCYNARFDNLDGFWKNQFGKKHGIIVINAFYENVKRHDFEQRELRDGEAEENMILEFRPEGMDEMVVPCIWDEWGKNGELKSFAIITNDPPKEIEATGHNRCPIFLKEENMDAWLNPPGKSKEELFNILKDTQKPFYKFLLVA